MKIYLTITRFWKKDEARPDVGYTCDKTMYNAYQSQSFLDEIDPETREKLAGGRSVYFEAVDGFIPEFQYTELEVNE